jgi:hypothetical protein
VNCFSLSSLIKLNEIYVSLKDDLEKYEGDEFLDMHFVIYNFVIWIMKIILNMQQTFFLNIFLNV